MLQKCKIYNLIENTFCYASSVPIDLQRHSVPLFKDEFIIIYARTRDETDLISKFLNDRKIKSLSYHAGLEKNLRNKIQKNMRSLE